jgi:hypothetical protein
VTRIPSHTIEDAPEASRPLLQNVIQLSLAAAAQG